MTNITQCPLCKNTSFIFGEKISTDCIIAEYEGRFNLDIADEFKGLKEIEYRVCGNCHLGYFLPAVAGSEVFYEKLQNFDWYYMDDKNEYDFSRKFIKSTDNVLEIGCGKGAFFKLIQPKRYLGLELSRKAKKLAIADDIAVLNETIQDHAINHRCEYDVICAFQVLEHVEDVYSFVKSAIDCLKPNGVLIFSTPSNDSFSAYVPNFILDMPPHHLTRWSDSSFLNLAKIFDIKVIEIWHEPLQKAHLRFYAKTLIFKHIMKILMKKQKIWDESISRKFISLICHIPAVIFALCLSKFSFHLRGISVTAVFRKGETKVI